MLADIYLGRIRKWNEAPIAQLNPGITLPNSNITVVHRADASGTSYLWSSFLALSSPLWQAKVGAGLLPAWPTGVAGRGNDGVASLVQRTKVSIGYVEYAYARQHNLASVSLRNRDGAFVPPSRASFEAAALAARWQDAADLQQQLMDQPGAGSWPITGASFILLHARAEPPQRSVAVMRFFDWALKHGQRDAAELDYVAMPDAAVALTGQAWAQQVHAGDGSAVWPAAGAH